MPLYALDAHHPRLADPARVWIAPDAQVIGQVEIDLDVSIWFSAVLRGDNEPIRLGARCNIQDGVVLHTDPGFPLEIGEDVTIGHRAIVHGCTVGANSLVGMGATLLNGARIGRNCLVGANALVTEGKEFPDNSLIVGAPAKAVRSLDEQAVEGLRLAAARYVANGRRYEAGLRRLDP
ncbi:transferase hexapeptide repeat containing protein [Methylobacterium sp. 4-46]|uniref:gamma carbonic anhydrase family protein n=1 Tax=unclassified Methylobacterium TaxID=2615210 RepID=UPI000152CF2E|nr:MULTISPECIES: gamma carbonic anhydrase family protein [Methylobacterium]ACA15032.1 transferase hexapeptide repeat containing protein [Methylobacterium sp. 4-46]WFT80770.1 gamma carbonic anhydrase family protein [Methylobacterium nodulans]